MLGSLIVLSAFAAHPARAGEGVGDHMITLGNSTLSVAAFEAMAPLASIETATPWHQKATFSGIPGRELARLLGLDRGSLVVTAQNDYTVEIPVSDLLNTGMIFATRINDEHMTIQDKGPVMVLYPFDSAPQTFQSAQYVAKSVWYVRAIHWSKSANADPQQATTKMTTTSDATNATHHRRP